MLVVARDPVLKFLDQLGGTAPFLEPQACLFQGAHDPFCVRVAFRVVIAGKVLLQKPVFDAFVENRVSIFQRVTGVKKSHFLIFATEPSMALPPCREVRDRGAVPSATGRPQFINPAAVLG
jgi:hypothetical protein